MKKFSDERISDAMKKYLIGKELKLRLQQAEADYVHAVEIGDHDYTKNHRLCSKGKIAAALGAECHLSANTVINYGNYSDTIEKLRVKNEKLVQQILSGQTNMTYKDLLNLLNTL